MLSQKNAMDQFNSGEANSMSKFNAEVENQRDQFNATNSLVSSSVKCKHGVGK